ncbi:MAG: GTPase HflX [Syntrophomonadaceae bacterium]|nr:GTPase HflX [Syntrophomonadaceae bacterium]
MGESLTQQINQGLTEKVILVGLETPNDPDGLVLLKELGRLADTAGAQVVDQILQKRLQPDPSFFIGRGKVEELRERCAVFKADLVIFNDELTPVQVRNLEQILNCRVLDRTNLILDIFAQRARTNEGKLQVELAQLRYLLPRLIGQGMNLSRLGAGLGTRGPGETKLETDRRHIRRRIRVLEQELDKIRQRRKLQRERRERLGLPVIALVGYTNAGKSTLLNRLSKTETLVEDQLFSTLDTLSRLVELPDGRLVLVSDTVGFVRKLPHHLVAAFRATLEEVREADLILHVVDLSSPEMENEKKAVEQVLREIGADNKATLLVYNKLDLLPGDGREWIGLGDSAAVLISAKKDQGIPELLQQIAQSLPRPGAKVALAIPLAETRFLSLIHSQGTVFSQDYQSDRILITAWLEPRLLAQLKPFIVKEYCEE